MELSARKRAVLAAIIRAYIETGEPVGSKNLTAMLENAPSPATLRNEMSELCNLGLLEQPHTSAGRIPTSRGYRLYVNSLMKPSTLTDSTRRYIDSMLSQVSCDARDIPRLAGQALCGLTGFPAVSCYIVGDDTAVKRAQLLPVSARTAVLLLVTSDGRTHSRVCRLAPGFSPQLTRRFDDIVNRRIKRRPLSEFNRATLQNVISAAGIDSFELMPVITDLFQMIAEASESPVRISGASSLRNICDEDGARRIISLAERGDPFLSIFEGVNAATDIIFGNDTGFTELNGTVLVVSKYNSGDRYRGRIGIIGSDRMSYEQIIPSIEYTASRLSALMTEAMKDMEG